MYTSLKLAMTFLDHAYITAHEGTSCHKIENSWVVQIASYQVFKHQLCSQESMIGLHKSPVHLYVPDVGIAGANKR